MGIEFEPEDLVPIQEKTHVVTGRLLAGWKINGSTIENDTDYASYVEFGTKFMDAQNMIGRSLEQIWENLYRRNPVLEYHDLLPGEMEIFIVGSGMGGILP